jgi:hypothetical protein
VRRPKNEKQDIHVHRSKTTQNGQNATEGLKTQQNPGKMQKIAQIGQNRSKYVHMYINNTKR